MLEETPEMLGCVSWVPLPDVPVEAGPPVLDQAEMVRLRAALAAILGQELRAG
ncbi:MAG: hypothetical protein AB1511_13890 [Deinococcota bacterium]